MRGLSVKADLGCEIHRNRAAVSGTRVRRRGRKPGMPRWDAAFDFKVRVKGDSIVAWPQGAIVTLISPSLTIRSTRGIDGAPAACVSLRKFPRRDYQVIDCPAECSGPPHLLGAVGFGRLGGGGSGLFIHHPRPATLQRLPDPALASYQRTLCRTGVGVSPKIPLARRSA